MHAFYFITKGESFIVQSVYSENKIHSINLKFSTQLFPLNNALILLWSFPVCLPQKILHDGDAEDIIYTYKTV